VLHCCIGSGGVCFGSGGACICAGGALCGVRALDQWFVLFVWAWFCFGCVEPLPLPKGSETCLLQVILFLSFLLLSIACWGFFLFISFSFSFLSCYFMWVLSMHSSRGRLRTMCDSRTGGSSLPCVMSDWQCCVNWFLAKYCRCRLRLDSCWCRWRTSAKGRRRWGLQVWRRQVGFVRGTRWPARSSAGRMVAWTANEVVDGFLVEPQNQGRAGTTWEPSHEWRLAEATLS
jgi:hypothetical protein